jgi:hypothetical protein
MNENDKLIALEKEKSKFLEENKSVFRKIEKYDKDISTLRSTISNKLISPLPFISTA